MRDLVPSLFVMQANKQAECLHMIHLSVRTTDQSQNDLFGAGPYSSKAGKGQVIQTWCYAMLRE